MADTKYVTDEELQQFSEELTKYVTDSITNEELAYSGVVKEYVESKTSELELKLVNNPEWLKVKANIEELVKIFETAGIEVSVAFDAASSENFKG